MTKYSHYVVAELCGELCGQYDVHHIQGYFTTWDVTVKISNEGAVPVSVRLRGSNLSKVSAESLRNYYVLHNVGII